MVASRRSHRTDHISDTRRWRLGIEVEHNIANDDPNPVSDRSIVGIAHRSLHVAHHEWGEDCFGATTILCGQDQRAVLRQAPPPR